MLAQRADAYCAAAATVWRLRLLCLLRLLGAYSTYSAYWAAAYLRGGYYCAAAAGLASGPRHPVVPPGCSPTWAAIAHLARLAFMRGEAAPGMRDGRMPCGRPTLGHVLSRPHQRATERSADERAPIILILTLYDIPL